MNSSAHQHALYNLCAQGLTWDFSITAGPPDIIIKGCLIEFCHTTDNSEVQEGQLEAAQVKKQDQSDSDEALYLPPLPPDQLDTVVKVTTAHTGS